MESNFTFLSKYWQDISELGQMAEKCLFSDPNTSILKAGILAEKIVKNIFRYENIEIPQDDSQSNLVRILKREYDLIPENINNILYTIRKTRNDAAHQYINDIEKAKGVLELAFELSCWFMETYGDWDFKRKKYVEPTKDNEENVDIKEYIKQQEERIANLEKNLTLINTEASNKSKEEREEKSAVAAENIISSLAEDSPALSITKEVEKLRIEIDSNPLISLCLDQNSYKIIKSIIIHKGEEDDKYKNLKLEITSNPSLTLEYKKEIDVLEKEETYFDDINIRLDEDKILKLSETINAYIEAKLINRETQEVLANEIVDIKFLPANFWQGTRILTDTLSSFVTPKQPEINKIFAEAAEKMRQLTGSSGFCAYQSNNPADVLNQAAAIYYAIKDLQIVYVEAPKSYEGFGQRIRLANEIIKYKQGNCLDLSLLYASCLEFIGLNPIIILESSHAYVGLWLTNDNFPDTVSDDKTQIIKRISEGVDEIAILESTFMVSDSQADFDEARNQAKTNILDEERIVEYIFDIKCCRLSGIKPLPLIIEDNGAWKIEHQAIYDNPTNKPELPDYKDSEDQKDINLTKMGQWEKKLLDLGLRNQLINMHLSRTIVPILSSKGCKEVVDALLTGKLFDLKACPVTWPRDPVKDAFESFCNSKDTLPLTEILERSITEKKFYTPFDEATLFKKLTQIYRTSRQSLEENGASTLYLATGLLKWCEIGNNKVHYAPLALVPIELTKRSGNLGYLLSFRQDDTQINITLLEKLKHDFSISLDGLEEVPEDENGPDIARILVTFNKAVMSKPNWTILNSCYIGNFSFSQFVMWNDIHNRFEDLKENKIVKSLIDGKLSWEAKPMHFEGQIDPEDTRLAVPVDGSQLFAIKEANNNKSFVLHGPPGTGKSQTITALIGNALAHGKTVLFVAEKRAALEVVEKRLNDIGIGPFCLELHSNKAKKNEVLSQIKNVLELRRKSNNVSFDKQLKNLNKCKSELNQYVKELHMQRNCGYSVFELINNYEDNRNYPELPSKINVNFNELTKDQITYLEGLIEDLVINAKVVGTPSENKLRYVGRKTYSIGLKEEIVELSEEYKNILSKLEEARTLLEMILPDNEYAKEEDYKELYCACENLKSIIDIPHKLLSEKECISIYDSIIKMCDEYILCKNVLDEILIKWNKSVLNTNFNEIFNVFEKANTLIHINEKLYLNDYNEICRYYDEIDSISVHYTKKKDLNAQIISLWKDSVFSLDADELLNEYVIAESKWFLARAIKINKIIKKLKDYSIGKINKDTLKVQLETLKEYQKEKGIYDELLRKYQDDLGALYCEDNTNWQDICLRASRSKEIITGLQKEISQLTDTFVDINAIKEVNEKVDEYYANLQKANEIYRQYSNLLDLSNKEETNWQELKENFIVIRNRVLTFDNLDANYVQLRTSFGGDKSIETLLDDYIEIYKKFSDIKQKYYKLLEMKDHPSNDWFEKENEVCDGIYKKASAIKEWLQWNDTCEKVIEENLGSAVEAYYKGYTNSQVSGGFKKTLYKELITSITNNEPTLNQFSGMLFDEKIRKYERLDAEFIEASRKEIYYTLLANLPDMTYEASQSSELGILQKAIKSNGRGLSIRKLFERITNILIRLCPCMLMSPISVAQYLDPKRAPFDLVVFDEASQLQTCKAVGALARGENAIVVGDPKQMPPTSFFMTRNNRNEDDIDFELEDMESILDDCLALTMPETNLLWHYRSRHESLIAFSNSQFYDNKLYTFPSVNDKESKVKFVKVNGTFIRKDGYRRINNIEAARIVAEIKSRYKDPEHTKQSVGVVTFNIAQSNLIQDLLQNEYVKDPDFEEWANRDYEPLFVKNLENVQGDERDVILFSITYGPDENGKVSMNFGPLNREKGWRRLNVAVSRAKEEMIVFSSMSADKIDAERTKAKGVLALKAFLNYAEKGILNNSENKQTYEDDGPAGIAKAITASLKSRGFKCDLNVGKSGYKVDVAVVDPFNEGNYILGILLDGLVYKNSNTIRDREIGQKSILNGLGWKIIRVWSMDWLDDKDSVINNIMKKIKSIIEGEDDIVEQSPIDTRKVREKQPKEDSGHDVKIKDLSYKYKPYTLVSSRLEYEPADFPYIPTKILLPVLKDIIKKEKIITLPLLSQRAARYFGCSKATFNVTNAVSAAAPSPIKLYGEKVYCSVEFEILQDEYKKFRTVDEETKIDFRYIPVIEIINAMCFVLLKNYAMNKESLIKETAKIMGYDRLGGLIEEKISKIIDLAFEENILDDTGVNSIILNREYRTELINNNTEIVD